MQNGTDQRTVGQVTAMSANNKAFCRQGHRSAFNMANERYPRKIQLLLQQSAILTWTATQELTLADIISVQILSMQLTESCYAIHMYYLLIS